MGLTRTTCLRMRGNYEILEVGASLVTTLDIDELLPDPAPYASPVENQNFKVLRQGLQRVTATVMADNEAEAGLYYFDVELLSEGTGDAWNIDAELQMTAQGYRSDGYYLTTDDEELDLLDGGASQAHPVPVHA